MKEKTYDRVLDFWEQLMEDPDAETKDRLKASENLAKALGGQEEEENLAPLRVQVDYGET